MPDFSSNRRLFLMGAGGALAASAPIALPLMKTASAAETVPVAPAAGLGKLQPHPVISSARGTEAFWKDVRACFGLGDSYVHMNTGTTGSMPLFVQNNLAVYNAYKSADPLDWAANLAKDFPDLVPLAGSEPLTPRQAEIAAMYGANADEIVLTYSTTDSFNLVISGIPWKEGDRIIVTNLEHSGMMGAVLWAKDYRGVQVATVAMPSIMTPSVTVADVLALFEKELKAPLPAGATQYVAFSEIPYKNGVRLPVKEICALAKSYGAYSMVDSAHGWGMLPINCHDTGADFIAGAGHKWLCGGPGTGILYVRNSGEKLPPFALGNFRYNPAYYNNRSWKPATVMQPRGEHNRPALLAMTDSARFFKHVGTDQIYARGVELGNYLKDKIAARWGAASLWVQKNPDPRFGTALTAFNPFVSKDDPAKFKEMQDAMNDVLKGLRTGSPRKIYIRTSDWRDGQSASDSTASNRIGLRVSTHAVYNNKDEIDLLVEQLSVWINKTSLKQLS